MTESSKSKEMAERKKEFRTTVDGIQVKRVYTPADMPGHEDEDIGLPGEYPFSRHIMSTGYRGRLWTMRQYAGFGTVEETNKRFKYLYEQGHLKMPRFYRSFCRSFFRKEGATRLHRPA